MMRITLAEEHDGQLLPAKTFEGRVVTVGRDGKRCQVIFRQLEWGMVSRVHAEFRWEDGRCMLADKDSSYGTFLDEKAIGVEPTEVRAGSRVRFGVEGPVMLVSSVSDSVADLPEELCEESPGEGRRESREEVTKEVREKERGEICNAGVKVPPRFEAQAPAGEVNAGALKAGAVSQPRAGASAPAKARSSIHLIGDKGALGGSFTLNREVMRIGRDPKLDVVIGTASSVSRYHAEIRKSGEGFVLADTNSFNGTLVNGERIAHAVPLRHGDEIQLGLHGPVFIFDNPPHSAREVDLVEVVEEERPAAAPQPAGDPDEPDAQPQDVYIPTSVIGSEGNWLGRRLRPVADGTLPIITQPLKPNSALSVGRAEGNDICLKGLQISACHALIESCGKDVFVVDNNSTNGVYVNGSRVTRQQLGPKDVVQISAFVLRVDMAREVVLVFDMRANTRFDMLDVSVSVRGRRGGAALKLLDEVSLSVKPNEFVGLLGPSGAGKSTLLGAMNGMRPAKSGRVLFNGLELYGHLDSLKRHIGYIPQDDISHRELTVYRTLYYVAQLRLSRDVSQSEIDGLIDDILDMTELSEQRDIHIAQLSGGQRKRVSIAVELVMKPSVLFLDEPVSGLDPANARRIMRLFRNVAETGRTIVMTTHLMDDVTLFDKIGILMRGRLVFYGTPREALEYFGVESVKEIYDLLEPQGGAGRTKASEALASELKSKFRDSEQYERHIGRQEENAETAAGATAPRRSRTTPYEQLLQWAILSRRYMEVASYDRTSILILLAQAPIIGILTFLAVKSDAARDFPFFVLALVSMWFGTSTAAREIVRERVVYARERMVNTRLVPYVGSKLFVLMLVVGWQCVLLFLTLKLFHVLGLMKLPGGAIPQLLVMILTGVTGVALGLLISAVSKTSEVATSIVPLVLIPQILFSGLIGVPTGPAKAVGLVMPTTLAFDELKVLSGLPVLRGAAAGGKPSGLNEGRGLYDQIEFENDQSLRAFNDYADDARRSVEDFRQKAEKLEDFGIYREGDSVAAPSESPQLQLKPVPSVSLRLPPKDLSGYVSYLHPSGGGVVGPLVLLLMLFSLTGATVLALRRQDVC